MGLSQRARAWTALSLPWLAWYGFQQGLQALMRVSCGQVRVGIAWGLASMGVCAGAAWLAWRPARRGAATVHPWLARLALIGCCFFGLAIAFQTLAIVMVPPCVR